MSRLMVIALLLSCVPFSMAQQQASVTTAQPAAKPTKSSQATNPGLRAFRANCSRCHSAPEQIPPSITGTVLRHMRVRASLSEADEKAILRYFAP